MSVQFHSLVFGFESHEKQVKSICPPFLFHRHVRDTSDSHRRRWPHLWQQRSSGLQYPPWPAVLFRWPQNRWENNRILDCHISTLWFIHITFDGPTLETKVCSNVETFGCSIWVRWTGSVMQRLSFHRLFAFCIIPFYSTWPGLYSSGCPGHHSPVTGSIW